jgi:serine/threonine protein kinase
MGLLVEKEGKVSVRNRIYEEVFNTDWVDRIVKESSKPQTLEEISSGTLIANRYRIERVLGQGEFGRTYLVTDTHRFGEPWVLKEFIANVDNELIQSRGSREMFRREAEILYELEHSQIPKFQAFPPEEGKLFIVQEYIQGKTYAALLEERKEQGNAFSEDEVIGLLKKLLPVLDYIHSQGIIHRDISLDNIMLHESQDQPMLIDFGSVSSAKYSASISPERLSKKFGYSPKEQIEFGQCYPSSDLYSLAVAAIALLTGQEPNQLLERDSLEWQWHSYVVVSDWFAGILDKMLEQKPENRYQSAQEVVEALRSPPSLQWKLANNFPSRTQGVYRVAFSSDGQTLASLGYEQNKNGLKTWNLTTSKSLSSYSLEESCHALTFNSEGQLLACKSQSGRITIWNLPGTLLYSLPDHLDGITCAAFSPDGQTLASVGQDGTVKLWELANRKKQPIDTYPRCAKAIQAIALSSDRQTLVFVHSDNTITVRNLRTGKQHPLDPSSSSDRDSSTWWKQILPLQRRNLQVNAIAISLDGKYLTSGGEDKKVRLWELRNRQLLETLSGHVSEVTAVAFSPDGKSLASGSRDGEILIFRQSF